MNIQILLLAGLWLLLQIMITTIDYKDKQIEPKQTEVKEEVYLPNYSQIMEINNE